MNDAQRLTVIQGVMAMQDAPIAPAKAGRVHYVADLDDDVDGSRCAYRVDNDRRLALDDIRESAGYPHGDWWNVLVRDPQDPSRPFVDADGFCISMTSYQDHTFEALDRRRYLDAVSVPYSVAPGDVRKRCKGVLLGCKSRITRLTDNKSIDCVTGDFSGYSIGEASDYVCKFFDSRLSARNGDKRPIYLFEFWPDVPAVVNGKSYKLIPA